MTNPANNIGKEARQGSVAAIIQVLNDKLADCGVRTRAVLSDGVLQLLCEASTVDQLEQSVLVEQVRQILESISPRNIRRVRLNSRIVREQQLLWLEEISRDPQGQLLWSQEITLARPNLIKRWLEDRQDRNKFKDRTPDKNLANQRGRSGGQFWRGIVGGVSLTVFLGLAGWAIAGWLAPRFNTQSSSSPANAPTAPNTPLAPTPFPVPPSPLPTAASTTAPTTPSPSQSITTGDPFVEAVRLAEETVAKGKNATTSAEWLDLAARWQRASDLMAAVTTDDQRYGTAQNRVELYRQHSEAALQEAERRRAEQ